jgi:hypothetical protein
LGSQYAQSFIPHFVREPPIGFNWFGFNWFGFDWFGFD